METTNILQPLLGGAIIGLAAVLLLLFNGRIAGISGILAGVLMPGEPDRLWRPAFIAGLIAGGLLLAFISPDVFPTTPFRSLTGFAVAGLLVGVGARLGSGCTSGHGVCGIGRFSLRGLVATVTFITTGAITVAVVNAFFGGSL